MLAPGTARESTQFGDVQDRAHVPSRLDIWKTSANPARSAAAVLQESLEFIRFVNPGDLRVADQACGACHETMDKPLVSSVRTSMMTHGAMLWGAALYNRRLPLKTYRRRVHTRDGIPESCGCQAPSGRDHRSGILPFWTPSGGSVSAGQRAHFRGRGQALTPASPDLEEPSRQFAAAGNGR
jgi:hypothetical protein